MPIKGMTDRESIVPRFERLGKLRKGARKTSETKPGEDLDHWRFTSDWPGAVEAFEAAYGKTPRQVSAYLAYSTVEQCFQTWSEKWRTGGLEHRCDGETCVLWLGDDGEYHQEPKPCPGGCSLVGRLDLMIPEMFAAGYVGVVTMETHGKNDLLSISKVLYKTAELAERDPANDLRDVLFNVRRVEVLVSSPAFDGTPGKRQRVKKWLVRVVPAVDWVQVQLAAAREMPALAMDVMEVDGQATVLEDWEDTENLYAGDARALAKNRAYWKKHLERLVSDSEYAAAMEKQTIEGVAALFPSDPPPPVIELKPAPLPEPLDIQPSELDTLTPAEQEALEELAGLDNSEWAPAPPKQDPMWDQFGTEVSEETPVSTEVIDVVLEAPVYPAKNWTVFRDFVVKAVPQIYPTGKTVAARLAEKDIKHPWLHWSPELAARCWEALKVK